jgi:outer membrane protein TolC
MKSIGKTNPRKINMKRIIIFSLLFAQLSLRAQEVKQFSLQEALAFTEQNNLSYLNAQYDVQIARETVKQTTSYGLPQVNATAGFQQYINIPGNWVNNFTKTLSTRVQQQCSIFSESIAF